MLQVAIIDDFEKDRLLLSRYLAAYCRQNHIALQISEFENGQSFFNVFRNKSFDIVFLDIYLDSMDGMQVAERIRESDESCLLVFVTSSEQHAVKSFRVRAFDYLLKPYTYEQFLETMKLCDQKLVRYAHYIEVKEGRAFIKIHLHEIIYTDYYNHYIQIHTKKRIIRTYMPFSEFSKLLLSYPQFLCCYRNCIINMDHVDAMDETDFLMSNGDKMPILRARRSEVRQQYADYAFERLDQSIF